jgi:hypothetical protein
MRTVDLGKAAAQAEVFRIRQQIERQARRAVFAAVALVFVTAMLVMAHVVAYIVLSMYLVSVWAAASLLAFDLVVALIFGLIAARSSPSGLELEARTIRDQALAEMKESVAITALMSPLTRVVIRSAGRKNLLGMMLAALTTTFLAKSRK